MGRISYLEQLGLTEEDIYNPWILYEQTKKLIPAGLPPDQYDQIIQDICDVLHV
jgi:hypothetical protein